MRHLTKMAAPASLIKNAQNWTLQYELAVLAGKPKPSVWSRKAIRNRLHLEVNERCAYCEVNILPSAPGDIEHMRPRDRFPELVVEWDNLTMTCPKCNSNKSSDWEDALPFVNPYVDAIEEHFVFLGAFVAPISDRGVHTNDTFELNEHGRPAQRQKVIDSVIKTIGSYRQAPTANTKLHHLQLLKVAAEEEYSETVKAVLRGANIPF